jgi:two-component system sensor histidine kinase TctE
VRSLSATLLAWLLPPLLVVGAVAAAGASVFMQRRLDAAYDQDLGDIARALVPYLRVSEERVWLAFDEQADAVLRADSRDRIYYAVKDWDGRLVAGDRSVPSPPVAVTDYTPHFWNDERFGRPVRAVALAAPIAGHSVTVIAVETTNKRESAASDAILSAIAPVAMLTLAAMAAVFVGVRRGLGPVNRLREELQARSHVDLSPVDVAHVADELQPLVGELNEMLGRLQTAQHAQARFIANAAHQLRTPIAGLVTQIDLARGPRGDVAHLEQARTAAARLARLAQQILSLAAADPVSNPSPPEEAVDLANVLKDRAETWLRGAGDVELEFDLQPAPVRGSELLLGELASNLVDNACRYGARTVRLATRIEGGRAMLEIEDDGPGIPPGERTRIFERFHRLAGPSTEGSGLGLAIVAEIAQRHGARIDVGDARASPTGTCVRVSFAPAR